ncbi:MAG: type III-B CRISPR module-associated protein Cmr5, partial [Candidatus Hydrothermales bacterium]
QERASFVLEKVKKIKEEAKAIKKEEKDKEKKDDDKIKKFKTNAKKVSSLIVSNGLIPTLAFLKAKEERRPVYNILNEWLKKKGYCNNDALTELVNSDFSKLRLATTEVLEFANWLKRIVEIELPEEK